MSAYIPVTKTAARNIISRYDRGETLEAIGATHGFSGPKICRFLREAGVAVRGHGPRALSPRQEREVVRLLNAGLSMAEIGRRLGCSTEPIKRLRAEARSQGLVPPRKPTRTNLPASKQRAILDGYRAGRSRRQLANEFDTYWWYVDKLIRQAGIERRDDRTRRGPNCPTWIGGRQICDGYVRVWIADDSPFASMRHSRGGYVLEHRLVMAQTLGRSLFPSERVHHKNGQKQDNRPENLELWEESHPPGQRSHEATSPHCPTCTCRVATASLLPV